MCVYVNRLPEEAFGAVRADVGGASADRADGAALRSNSCSSEGGVALHRSGHHLPGRSLRVHRGLAGAAPRSHQARQVSITPPTMQRCQTEIYEHHTDSTVQQRQTSLVEQCGAPAGVQYRPESGSRLHRNLSVNTQNYSLL